MHAILIRLQVTLVSLVVMLPQVDRHGPTFEIQPEEKRYA